MTDDLAALAARTIFPILDLRRPDQLPAVWARARDLAGRGVGGFILFGGDAATLAGELAALRALAPRGLLIGSDLERGLGQQVKGGAQQPPLLALGAANDPALAERAGFAVARDALALGIDWLYGPVLDLADEPRNPIVGTRSLGASPEKVAELGAAVVRGIQRAGALACAKHWPGHGATTDDSHAALPVVTRARDALMTRDLLPFRRAVAAGVASIMTAHVAYPTLSTSPRLAATLDPALISGLLRQELGFDGIVVTDAMIMDGVLLAAGGDEGLAACKALEAGCDALLYPKDPLALAARVAAWARERPSNLARLREAVGRIDAGTARTTRARASVARPPEGDVGDAVARAALTRVGPAQPALKSGEPVRLLVLDDDDTAGLGHELVTTLSEAGVAVSPFVLRAVDTGAPTRAPVVHAAPGTEQAATTGANPDAVARAREHAKAGRRVVVVGCRVRAWKGRPGLAPGLAQLLSSLDPAGLTVVGLCGPAPLLSVVPRAAELLLGYGDEQCVQAAAAGALLGAPAPGRLPIPA